MRTDNVVNFVVKAAVWALSCCGVFLAFGSVGSLECTDMTMIQFFFQEFIAFVFIFASLIVYTNKETLNHYLIKN